MNSSPQAREEFVAGFKLLDKFQDQWEQIHAKSESNVIKTKTAITKLGLIEKSSTQRLKALDNFNSSFKSLYKLEEQIKDIHSDLRLLESHFVKIEDLLLVLKNYNEQVEVDRLMRSVDEDYQTQERELRIISKARVDRLKVDHLRRVDAFEQEQQKALEERRQILEKAFEEEKNRYLEQARKS